MYVQKEVNRREEMKSNPKLITYKNVVPNGQFSNHFPADMNQLASLNANPGCGCRFRERV